MWFGFHSSYHRINSFKRPTSRSECLVTFVRVSNDWPMLTMLWKWKSPQLVPTPLWASVKKRAKRDGKEEAKGENPSSFIFPPQTACHPEEWTRNETCIGTLPSVIITLPSFLLILSTESAHTMCKLLFFAFFCHFGFANRFTRSLWKGTGTLKSDMRLTWLPRPEVSEIPWHFLDKCKISLTNSELS